MTHASPHAPEIADEIGLLMHSVDRLDAGRDAAGNLSPAGAVDYQGYSDRILGLLRSINLYPVAAA
jgi:hypothetical protein